MTLVQMLLQNLEPVTDLPARERKSTGLITLDSSLCFRLFLTNNCLESTLKLMPGLSATINKQEFTVNKRKSFTLVNCKFLFVDCCPNRDSCFFCHCFLYSYLSRR